MIKRYRYVGILVLIFLGTFFFLRKEFVEDRQVRIISRPKKVATKIDLHSLQIDGKRVIGLKPGHEKEELENLKVANSPSSAWQPALEETLRLQAGNSLKEIKFNKVDSFVWAQDGMALFVESVIVTLKNDKNAETTFRVLVDAQNGKILKNWDQPVFDPMNPRDNFRIKIDPRYHGQ